MQFVRGSADIVESGKEFSTAVMRAVERGDAAEDHSQGHAFTHDPATRTIQERFVAYAKRIWTSCVSSYEIQERLLIAPWLPSCWTMRPTSRPWSRLSCSE